MEWVPVKFVREMWLGLHKPRIVTFIQSCIYLLALNMGVAVIIAPPLSVIAEWDDPLPTLWAGWFIFGGAIGAVGCLIGHWWAERIGILSLIVATAMYLSAVSYLHFVQEGNRVVQALLITWVLLHLAQRLFRISGQPLDPSRGAEFVEPE